MLCSSVGRPNRPDLRDVRRAQPRHAALAFDRLDHRRLFAADVGAGAAPQVDRRQRAGRRAFQHGEFLFEDRRGSRRIRRAGRCRSRAQPAAQAAISMPSRKRCGSRSRYQRSLKVPGSPSSMLTAIRRGAGSAATMRHLRPAGKPAPPRPRRPESSMILVIVLARALAGEAVGQQLVAAGLAVGGDSRCRVCGQARFRVRYRALRPPRRCAFADRVLSHHRAPARLRSGRRRARASPARPCPGCGQVLQQLLRAGQLAGDRVAHAHRERRRRGLAFLHHVEVVVEGRDLVDLGLRRASSPAPARPGAPPTGGRSGLDLVQVLDQQVAAARRVAEQRLHFLERLRVDRPALGMGRTLATFMQPLLSASRPQARLDCGQVDSGDEIQSPRPHRRPGLAAVLRHHVLRRRCRRGDLGRDVQGDARRSASTSSTPPTSTTTARPRRSSAG